MTTIRRNPKKATSSTEGPQRRPPAPTFEDREHQVVAAAINLAESQILNGTASSQVITHYLKLGSTREHLEQERLRNENLLTQARIEAMESQKRVEDLYKNALSAMKSYTTGIPPESEEDEEGYYD